MSPTTNLLKNLNNFLFVFVFCKDLRIWDISSHCCLKSVRLQFPCQQPAQILEHGNFPFLLPSSSHCQRAHLVVGCKDYLALLPLAEWKGGEGDWSGVSPHSSAALLSCALYNPNLRLLVTGRGDSSVFTWDVDSLSFCGSLRSCHNTHHAPWPLDQGYIPLAKWLAHLI